MEYYKKIISDTIETMNTVEFALRGRQEMMTTREFILKFVGELEAELSKTPPVEVHISTSDELQRMFDISKYSIDDIGKDMPQDDDDIKASIY